MDTRVKITHVLTDCDGCLTDNRVLYMDDGTRARFFSVYDGYGFALLKEAGIAITILSGENDNSILRRAAKLDVPFIHTTDKLRWFKNYLSLPFNKHLTSGEFAFLGNDVADLPLLKTVGFPACPGNAHNEVFNFCFYDTWGSECVMDEYGGEGAFRELAERVLRLNSIIENHQGY